MLTLLKSIECLINHIKSRNYSSSKNLSFTFGHLHRNQLDHIIDEMDHKKGAKRANRRKRKKKSNSNTTGTPSTSTGAAPGTGTTTDTSEITDWRFRPTHFAAIQVDDPSIVDKIRQVQKDMLEKSWMLEIDGSFEDYDFKKTMINVNKLHFTLEIFQLRDNNEYDIAKAKLALENVWEKFQEELNANPPEMKIKGIGHFNDKVLFAELQNPESIEKIAHAIRTELINTGLKTEKGRVFKPHLTIAKLSKDPSLYRKRIKKFPQDIWIQMKDDAFGVQKFKGIQLLSMVDPEDPDTGYYHEIDSKTLTLKDTKIDD